MKLKKESELFYFFSSMLNTVLSSSSFVFLKLRLEKPCILWCWNSMFVSHSLFVAYYKSQTNQIKWFRSRPFSCCVTINVAFTSMTVPHKWYDGRFHWGKSYDDLGVVFGVRDILFWKGRGPFQPEGIEMASSWEVCSYFLRYASVSTCCGPATFPGP